MSGRVAILGAAGGIGAACAAAFAEAGWAVEAADLAGAARAVDVTDAAAVAAFAEATRPRAMVYAAGRVATMPIAQTDFAAYRALMAVNLDGAFHAAAAFARVMEPGGAMVFLSSAAGLRGEARASAYCASKFGVIGLVEAVAAELVPRGIRVNAVAPGNVDTPMLRAVARGIAEAEGAPEAEVWARLARAGAARRIIAPQEVARVCLALASPGFSAVTGTTVRVDAGYLVG